MKIKLPLKPDDPIIQTINALIENHARDVRCQQDAFKRRATELAQAPDYERELTSYETTERRKHIGDSWGMYPKNLEDMEILLRGMRESMSLCNELTRMKLGLFKDVDFQQGDYWKILFSDLDKKKEEKTKP